MLYNITHNPKNTFTHPKTNPSTHPSKNFKKIKNPFTHPIPLLTCRPIYPKKIKIPLKSLDKPPLLCYTILKQGGNL